MRNDLRVACVHCALRLPARFAHCPRCRGATVRPDQALVALEKASVLSARVGRPLRDAFLFYPVVLVVPICLAAGVGLGFAGAQAFDANLGERIAGAVIGLCTGVAAAVSLVAMVWVAWALVVMLVGWATGGGAVARASERHPRPRLRPVPWPGSGTARPPPDPWLPRAPGWARGHLRSVGLVFVSVPLVELGAWMLTSDGDATLAKSGIGGALILQAAAVATATIPIWVGVWWTLWLLDRARLARHLLATRAEATSQVSEPAPARLRTGREAIHGRASLERGAPLRAPLSGEPCLAFRLTGHIFGVPIDDAEVGPLAIETASGERVTVHAGAIALEVPPPDPWGMVVDDAVRARLDAFVRARHLPERLVDHRATGPRHGDGAIDLGETLLREGDPVVAWGGVRIENVAGGGYRQTRDARILVEDDEAPMLLASAAPESPSRPRARAGSARDD